MSTGHVEYAYLIAKILVGLIAGGYGVFATVTDFHEKRDGRQVLSKGGKLGIAVLLISISAGIGVDTWKEISENQSSARVSDSLGTIANNLQQTSDKLTNTLADTNERLHQAQDSLDESSVRISSNVKISRSVLDDTRRALDPIEREWVLVDAEFAVPASDALVGPYLARIEDECQTAASDRVNDLTFSDSSSSYPDPKRPDESVLAELGRLQELDPTKLHSFAATAISAMRR